MKVIILADTHAGVRNNSQTFLIHQIRFFEEVLFPFVEERGIVDMIHLGDVFDRRKETNTLIYHEWDERVFSKWNHYFEESHIIIGNHDTYYRNSNKINAPERFLSQYKNFKFYSNPTEVNLYGVETLMLPWICEENEEKSKYFIENSSASLVLGHLEILGCPLFRGVDNNDHGFEQSVFSRFPLVLSGHFHIKSKQKNIHYVGSPYGTMWSEAFDIKGFHVLDTETLTLEFVRNPHNLFVHIDYNDTPIESIPDVNGRIVRVVVKNKTSDSDFLAFLSVIEQSGASEVNVQDQSILSVLVDTPTEEMDIFSLMDAYIDSIQSHTGKKELKKVLRDLYQEALQLHGISE